MIEYHFNTISDSTCEAIKKAYCEIFPELKNDCQEPFVSKKSVVVNNNNHIALYVFGNTIYMDPASGHYIVRDIEKIIIDDDEEFADVIMKECGIFENVPDLISFLMMKHLNVRLSYFYANEVDNEGNEIPFSSPYECAIRGKEYKEYEGE